MAEEIYGRIVKANYPSMVVTMGSRGAVWAAMDGDRGYYPPETVKVRDTTGAGDAFCAGVAIGCTYGKSMRESVRIGTGEYVAAIEVAGNTVVQARLRENDSIESDRELWQAYRLWMEKFSLKEDEYSFFALPVGGLPDDDDDMPF